MSKRVKNPRTGELLPDGYDIEANGKRIIAPDGFAFPAVQHVSDEQWWRDADAAAGRDMKAINTPYASEEERLADLHRPTAEGYTHILAGDRTATEATAVTLDGIDVSAAYERAATGDDAA